jgi:very-short-patch-repair endonuclease
MNTAHRPVSRPHRGRAKALRREMTEAERRLWAMLRGHRLAKLPFHRQSPLGPYIVDFVCHELRLVIEIDGGQHAIEAAKDLKRDDWLRSKEYRVLRFWNPDIFENRDSVLQVILDAIPGSPPPSLTLPLKGGGKEQDGGGE